MRKRWKRSEFFLSASSKVAAAYLRFVRNRATVIREPADIDARIQAQAPCIVAMWHGQFLMIPTVYPQSLPFRCMVARHGDAEIVSRTLERFGLTLIRGAGAGMRARRRNKDRGGATALRLALTALEEGACVPMTADVPPGPARIGGGGIVTLARLSGRPIVPVAVATSRFKAFDTWSRFTLNLPSSKLGIAMGEPIHVARDASPEDQEAARLAVEAALNDATRRAYALVGRDMAETLPASVGGVIPRGLTLRAYRALSWSVRPVAGLFLRRRSRQGKEVAERLGERMGQASMPRPASPLLWFHAASVGETNTILPLIQALRRERPELGILLTTVTVTSSRIAAARLPQGAIHQFVPLDTPAFVTRFFDHWRPDLALFTESEIWPNLILEAKERGVPLALLNARMSDRSFQRWLKMPGLSRPLFSRFDLVLAQSDKLAKRLKKLGASRVLAAGNLKFDAPPPPIDAAELARLREMLRGRPLFLAASTHPGEDEIIAQVHRATKPEHPDLLTIIVPRHPERGPAIAALAQEMGLAARLRSRGETPGAETDLYISDTIGELGLYYSLAPFAFIGGSLVPHGGQNPIEAIKLGAGVITGPHWHNFPEVYQLLAQQAACRFVTGAEDLAGVLRELLADSEGLGVMRAQAEAVIAESGGALRRTMEALEPFLPPKAAPAALTRICYAP
jgi:3-deoxy-D-manno-octulosonic-acid transferase